MPLTSETSRAVAPTAVLVAPAGSEHAHWLASRRHGIGGSDIAAVLGMSRYTSPIELYLDKVGELGDVPRSPELVEAAFWGHQHEPTIAKVFAERTGLGVAEGPGMLAHVERRWMLANVDRYVIEKGERAPSSLLEIKTRSAFQLDEWLLGVPDGPALQTHWYLAVTGYTHAHVAALLGGNRLLIHRIERDDGLVEHLAEIVGRFWQNVLDRIPPPPDGSEATRELLAHLYDVAPDSVTVADPATVLPLLKQRAAIKVNEQLVADELRLVDNQLKATAGTAEVVKADGETAFTWKQNGTFAAKKFADAHPDLAAQYTHHVTALDTKRLAAEHPDLFRKFRARRLVVPAKKESNA
ncbi:YqaJ viral recombinase family protein [Streptomyces sp. NPDC091266]|uniref:YqaJ viral recombinase family nuclease n=1 Tax=Streptomyces sp. NPDC091266 TaxID=3365978 RepID=UPI0037FD7321